MSAKQIEALRVLFTDRYVTADSRQPELARFAGIVGQVKTVNMTGRALVQFQGADIAWHDIAVDHLALAEKPPEPPMTKCAAALAKKSL
jgi:hypothetical protein